MEGISEPPSGDVAHSEVLLISSTTPIAITLIYLTDNYYLQLEQAKSKCRFGQLMHQRPKTLHFISDLDCKSK